MFRIQKNRKYTYVLIPALLILTSIFWSFHEENELHEQEKTSEDSVSQEEIVPEEEKTSVVAVDSDGKNIWIMISCVVLAIVVILGIVFIKKKK